MILRDLYTTLLRGSLDNVFEDENLRLINERTSVLLNKPNWTIQDQIKTEEIRRFLRDILTIDSGLINTDTTSQVHKQGARTC